MWLTKMQLHFCWSENVFKMKIALRSQFTFLFSLLHRFSYYTVYLMFMRNYLKVFFSCSEGHNWSLLNGLPFVEVRVSKALALKLCVFWAILSDTNKILGKAFTTDRWGTVRGQVSEAWPHYFFIDLQGRRACLINHPFNLRHENIGPVKAI